MPGSPSGIFPVQNFRDMQRAIKKAFHIPNKRERLKSRFFGKARTHRNTSVSFEALENRLLLSADLPIADILYTSDQFISDQYTNQINFDSQDLFLIEGDAGAIQAEIFGDDPQFDDLREFIDGDRSQDESGPKAKASESSSGPGIKIMAAVTGNGTGAGDAISVNAGNFTINGGTAQNFNPNDDITINGLGGDDTFTINDMPSITNGTFVIDGGAGTNDTVIFGNSIGDLTFTYNIDDQSISVSDGSKTIKLINIENIEGADIVLGASAKSTIIAGLDQLAKWAEELKSYGQFAQEMALLIGNSDFGIGEALDLAESFEQLRVHIKNFIETAPGGDVTTEDLKTFLNSFSKSNLQHLSSAILADAVNPTINPGETYTFGIKLGTGSVINISASGANSLDALVTAVNTQIEANASLVGKIQAVKTTDLRFALQVIDTEVDSFALTAAENAVSKLGFSSSKTISGLIDQLKNLGNLSVNIAPGVTVDVAVNTTTGAPELRFNINYSATRTTSFSFDLGDEAKSQAIEIEADAKLDLAASLLADFSIGLVLDASPDFFLDVNSFTVNGQVNPSHSNNVNASMSVGFLGASITGMIALDVTLDNFLNKTEGITVADLALANIGNLIISDPSPVLDLDMNLTVSVDAGLGFSPGGLTITMTDGNPFLGGDIDINFSSGFDEVFNFKNMSAPNFVALMGQIRSWMDQLRNSELFSSLSLPFAQAALSDIFDFADMIGDTLLYDDHDDDDSNTGTAKLLDADGNPTFSTAQELAVKLATILGVDLSVIGANYNATTDALTFNINFTGITLGTIDVPVDFDIDLGSIIGISSDSMVRLTAAAGLSLTLGIDLGAGNPSKLINNNTNLLTLFNANNISDIIKIRPSVSSQNPPSANMTNNPTLTFTSSNTIIRSAGTWAADGFKVGQIITIGKDPAKDNDQASGNNGTYLITNINGNTITVEGTKNLVADSSNTKKVVGGPVVRLSSDATFDITIGSDTYRISIQDTHDNNQPQLPNTADNTNLYDLIGDINSALMVASKFVNGEYEETPTDLSKKIDISASGGKLIFTLKDTVSETSFSVTSSGSAITDLGFTSSQSSSNADLLIYTQDSSGSPYAITLDNVTTIENVIDAINNQTNNKVTASISADQKSLKLVDTTSGSNTFKVEMVNGSPAALVLGIMLADPERDTNGDDVINDLDKDGIIIGSAIGGTTLADRLFVENAAISGSFSLSTPDDLDIDNDGVFTDGIKASASFGFVGIALDGGGSLTGSISAGIKDANGVVGGKVTLNELLNGIKTPSSIIGLTKSGTADLTLGLKITPDSLNTLITNLGVNPRVHIEISDIFNLTTPGALNVTLPDLGDLLKFDKIGFAQIIAGLQAMSGFLSDFEAFGFLSEPIPVINVSINDMLSFANKFSNALNDAQNNPAGNIQFLEDAIKNAFGLPASSDVVDLSLAKYDNGTPGDTSDDKDVLKLTMHFDIGFNESLGLDFDLGGAGILAGSADLMANGSLAFDLALGIVLDFDFQNIQNNFVIFESTGITGEFNAGANDLFLQAAVGPLGVFIRGGTVNIGGNLAGGKLFNLGLKFDNDNNTDLAKPISQVLSNIKGNIEAEIGGGINVNLPVYFPTESIHKGSVGFDMELSYNAITGEFTPPDLTDALKAYKPDGIALYDNFADLFDIDLSSLSLIDKILLAADGFDVFLKGLQDILDGEVFGISIPLIGDSLADGARFIEDFRRDFVAPFRIAVENSANPNENVISQLLFDLLVPTGLLLVDHDNNPNTAPIQATQAGLGTTFQLSQAIILSTNVNEAGVLLEQQFMQWNIILGQSVTLNNSIDFDLGIPGLGLETQGAVELDMNWQLDLGFGISFADGFYFDISDPSELSVGIEVTIPNLTITGKLGFLQISATDKKDINNNGLTKLGATFAIDIYNKRDPNDTRLGFSELSKIGVSAGLAASAHAELLMSLELNSDLISAAAAFPKIKADFVLDWGIGDWANGVSANQEIVALSQVGNAIMTGLNLVEFQNVRLDLGSFISDFIEPILKEIQKITKPAQPVIDMITSPLPVLSDLGINMTFIDIAAAFGKVDPGLIYSIADIITLVNSIPTGVGSIEIPFGSFTIYDKSDSSLTPDLTNKSLNRNDPNLAAFDTTRANNNAANQQNFDQKLNSSGANSSTKNFMNRLKNSEGFSLPILTDPTQVFNLLMGKEATLFEYKIRPLDLTFEYKQFFSIFGPLGVSIGGSISAHIDFHSVGLDTYGFTQFANSGFRNPLLIFNGFFISDLDANGVDVPEVILKGGLTASAELNLGVARAGVEGGIFTVINFDLYDPNKDGKIRIEELIGNVANEIQYGNPALSPLAIFDVSGRVFAKLYAFLEINLLVTTIKKEFNITPEIEILNFQTNFFRPPKLASILDDTVLQLNMGMFADQRLNGNLTDHSEKFYVKSTGNPGEVKVWAPDLGISEANAQTYSGFTKILALGGEGNDIIDLSGIVSGNYEYILEGGVGNDIIKAGTTSGSTAVIRGGLGDDEIWGSGGNDIIYGEKGNDTIHGGGGNDIIFGDSGEVSDDLIQANLDASDGNDTIYGDDGNDIIIGGGGKDTIYGNDGNDFILADNGVITLSNGTITGVTDTTRGENHGNDIVDGGAGNDTIYGGKGNDNIQGGAGNDIIYGEDGFDTLSGDDGDDKIYGGNDADVISGGAGNDELYGENGSDIIYGNEGNDKIYGGKGADIIFGHAGDDELYGEGDPDIIFGGDGDDYIDGGASSDIIFGDNGFNNVQSASDLASATFHSPKSVPTISSGAGGNDYIVSKLGDDIIDGQGGVDTYDIYVNGGVNNKLVTVFDTGAAADGADIMNIHGTPVADNFLLRAEPNINGLALVAQINSATQVERIDYTRNIEDLLVRGYAGNDTFTVDDNRSATTLDGGTGDDRFQIGQLFQSMRLPSVNVDTTGGYRADTGIAVNDGFATIETTRGFLSNGISMPMTVEGGSGNDTFIVFHNKAVLTLNGGSGDDTFIVRAFALAGSQENTRERTDISGGADSDYVEYAVNAPVNIDGGDGLDTVIAVGTEFGDDFVVTKDGIYGAGLNVNFVNIEVLEIDGAEGNDRFFILSTGEGIITSIAGGLGEDTFWVGGDTPPVISNDLLGHSGIITHSIENTSTIYDNLKIEGISVNVADNEEPAIVVTPSAENLRIIEGGLFVSYTVVLTRKPTSNVVVTAVAPRPTSEDEEIGSETLIFVDKDGNEIGTSVALEFNPLDWDNPQTVYIKAINDNASEGTRTGMINHVITGDMITGSATSVSGTTFTDTTASFQLPVAGVDEGLRGAILEITSGVGAGQSRMILSNSGSELVLNKPWNIDPEAGDEYVIKRYDALAIPSVEVTILDNDKAGVILTPSDGINVVTEGIEAERITDTYTIALTTAPSADVVVHLSSADGQLNFSSNTLTFTTGNWMNPQTVTISAVDDAIKEGKHYAYITHTTTSTDAAFNGLEITDMQVVVGDDEVPGVLIIPTHGSTNVIEGGTQSDGVPLTDTYKVILTQKPTADVIVTINSEVTKTSRSSIVHFGDQLELSTTTLIFTPDNWNQAQTVIVSALDDFVVDGGDTKVFAPQPHVISEIQGPLYINGSGGAGSAAGLNAPPVMLPGETNIKDNIGSVLSADTNSITVDDAAIDLFGEILGPIPGSREIGLTIEITDGTGAGQARIIASNDGNEIIITEEWDDVPDATSRYTITVTNPNFFVNESTQVDIMTVFNEDSMADNVGTLTATHLSGLGMGPGGIHYQNLENLTIHLGHGDDNFTITGTHHRDDFRTVTIVNTGSGNDRVTVSLEDGTHGLLALDTQTGDDMVDASASSLPLIIFGGEGNDSIIGGSGKDIIFGDKGRVDYFDEDGMIVTRLGYSPSNITGTADDASELSTLVDSDANFPTDGSLVGLVVQISGGTGIGQKRIITGNTATELTLSEPWNEDEVPDSTSIYRITGVPSNQTDGVFRDPTLILTLDSTTGGNDKISGNGGDDTILGGYGADTILGDSIDAAVFTHLFFASAISNGSAGKDLLIGDSGRIDFKATSNGKTDRELIQTIAPTDGSDDTIEGNGNDDIILGGIGADTIDAGEGNNIVLGDNGQLNYLIDANPATIDLIETTPTELGGDDTITSGNGDDIILGGYGADLISAGNGNNIVIGDNGILLATGGDLDSIESLATNQGGSDTITAGSGHDTIIGGTAGDDIDAGEGNNIVLGDSGKLTYASGVLSIIESISFDIGGDDTISTGDGNDIVLGGIGSDTIAAANGNNTVFGDNGILKYLLDNNASTLDHAETLATEIGGDDLITIGDGNDIVFGGQGKDIIAAGIDGDDNLLPSHGNNIVVGDNGKLLATGGLLDSIESLEKDHGDTDTISTGDGDDTIIGGTAGDIIDAGQGKNVVLGDSGILTYLAGILNTIISIPENIDAEAINVNEISSDDIINTGDDDDLIIGGYGNDVINAGNGLNVVIGDNGEIFYISGMISQIKTTSPAEGGNDTITTGDDADIILGGVGDDYIISGAGNDIVLGDNGCVDYTINDNDTSDIDLVTVTDPNDGGSDTIFAGEGNDIVIGGTAGDVIDGGSGNDLIFGDHAKLEGSVDGSHLPLDMAVHPFTFISIFTGADDGGYDDLIYGREGDDIILGQQGDDILFGNEGNDDIIGGHNVVGGIDELEPMDGDSIDAILGNLAQHNPADVNDLNDIIDGGSGNDVIAGDNAVILRISTAHDPRFRTLDGSVIYTMDTTELAGIYAVDTGFHANVTGDAQLNPDVTVGRLITLLDHSEDIQNNAANNPLVARVFGNDAVAGGSGNDEIFGQLGDDILQGDGEIILDGTNLVEFNPAVNQNPSFTLPDFSIHGENLLFSVVEAATDGDDYIEGNGGNDRIYGGLGQDDLIGGSSDLFGLDSASKRPDGADLIYGGAGDPDRLARNAETADLAARHARDADTILGDNGNIYRLVAVNGNGTQYLKFNYDDATLNGNGYSANLRIIPRAVDLLDYQYSYSDISNPDSLSFSAIGLGDLIYGESGDDIIYGMAGNDVLFGNSDDDDIIGGHGEDWISGGTGIDGILGDDGLIYTSRNTKKINNNDTSLSEPLYNIAKLDSVNTVISTPGNIQQETINIDKELKKSVNLIAYEGGGNDILYGGLGSDFIHAGSGDDAISGAEALPIYYYGGTEINDFLKVQQNAPDGTPAPAVKENPFWYHFAPYNPGDILRYDGNNPGQQEFALYDEYNPRRKIMLDANGHAVSNIADAVYDFLLNFNENEGPNGKAFSDGSKPTDGDDRIFGDTGHDWIVGGTGRDHLYGGMGDDLINMDDNHNSTPGSFENTAPDEYQSYGDIAYGGAGRDVLIINTGADRAMDWVGEFNSYITPFSPFGAFHISRSLMPALPEYLYKLSQSDGADTSVPDGARYVKQKLDDPARVVSPDPLRNGEPYGELGIVLQKDYDWHNQTGAPNDPQPGNLQGTRDIMRRELFSDPNAPLSFASDKGVLKVQNGTLTVSPTFVGENVVALYHMDIVQPPYMEILVTVNADKDKQGYKSNAYIIFDYQSPTDFKFAGIEAGLDKLRIGRMTEAGWIVDVQSNLQIRDNTNYQLTLALHGTLATLYVDQNQSTKLSYNFSDPLNDFGMVGLATDNSLARFDNFQIQKLPPNYTFDYKLNFDQPVIAPLEPQMGNWQVLNGQLAGAPQAGNNLAVSTWTLDVAPSSRLEIEAMIKTSTRAGVVFDYYGEDNFKFAALLADSNQVVIGHYTSKGIVIDASANMGINVNDSYKLGVSLVGSSVSVTVNGKAVVGNVYNSLLNDGDLGLFSLNGQSWFDDINVRGDDPAYRNPDGSISTLMVGNVDSSNVGDENGSIEVMWVFDEQSGELLADEDTIVISQPVDTRHPKLNRENENSYSEQRWSVTV